MTSDMSEGVTGGPEDAAGSLGEFIDGKVEAVIEPDEWSEDRMAILFAAVGPLIWLAMAIRSIDFAALAVVCHAQIGFFLWLIALGYRRPRAARGALAGIGICLVLSLISWLL